MCCSSVLLALWLLWKWPWLLPNFDVHYLLDNYYLFDDYIADSNADVLGKPVESVWGRGMDWMYCMCLAVYLFLL